MSNDYTLVFANSCPASRNQASGLMSKVFSLYKQSLIGVFLRHSDIEKIPFYCRSYDSSAQAHSHSQVINRFYQRRFQSLCQFLVMSYGTHLRSKMACNVSLNCPCVRGFNVCIFCVDAHFFSFFFKLRKLHISVNTRSRLC